MGASAPFHAPFWSGVAALFTRISEARARRRVVHGLAAFDDHMLRDIGLNRSDVDSALVEPILSDPTLVLARRAGEFRRHQRALAYEAQARAAMMPRRVA